MATVHTVLVIKHEDMGEISEAVSKFDSDSGERGVNALVAYLMGVVGGAHKADFEMTIRDTDPAVATSGAGSVQRDWEHK